MSAKPFRSGCPIPAASLPAYKSILSRKGRRDAAEIMILLSRLPDQTTCASISDSRPSQSTRRTEHPLIADASKIKSQGRPPIEKKSRSVLKLLAGSLEVQKVARYHGEYKANVVTCSAICHSTRQ